MKDQVGKQISWGWAILLTILRMLTFCSLFSDNWLLQQQQEKRRCRCIGWSVALAIALIITAAVVVGWYFTTIRKV
jgi:hypothetical protein